MRRYPHILYFSPSPTSFSKFVMILFLECSIDKANNVDPKPVTCVLSIGFMLNVASSNIILHIFFVSVRRCKGRFDLGFIIDSSGSLTTEYQKEKEFVKLLADSFQVSRSGTRAGIVLFSSYAKLSVKLSDHHSTVGFKAAVDDLPLMNSATRIDKAVTLAHNELFIEKNGGRRGVSKILILLTDGSQTPAKDAKDPSELAKAVRNSGVKLLVVGIGVDVNKTELVEIAGDESNLYMANTFDDLISVDFIRNISEISCRKGKLLPPISLCYHFKTLVFT